MSFVLKYKDEIQKKIRFIEEGTAASVLSPDMYAQNVGHRAGLMDALTILDQALGEMAMPEDNANDPAGIEDDEQR